MTETQSSKIFARNAKFNRIERVTDKLGRVLGFKNLATSERKYIEAWSPGLDGMTTAKIKNKGDDGIEQELELEIPKRIELYLAASLREVDGHPMDFPRNRRELDAVMDALEDGDGFGAAMEAFVKLNPKPDGEDKAPDIIDQAKN